MSGLDSWGHFKLYYFEIHIPRDTLVFYQQPEASCGAQHNQA